MHQHYTQLGGLFICVLSSVCFQIIIGEESSLKMKHEYCIFPIFYSLVVARTRKSNISHSLSAKDIYPTFFGNFPLMSGGKTKFVIILFINYLQLLIYHLQINKKKIQHLFNLFTSPFKQSSAGTVKTYFKLKNIDKKRANSSKQLTNQKSISTRKKALQSLTLWPFICCLYQFSQYACLFVCQGDAKLFMWNRKRNLIVCKFCDGFFPFCAQSLVVLIMFIHFVLFSASLKNVCISIYFFF